MGSKLRILLVEDEYLPRQTLHFVLSRYPDEFEIVGEAGNGKEALALLQRQRPDVMLCDVVMPVMNGLELLERLRKDGETIPTIVLSGYSDFELVRPAFQLGIVDYILKPQLTQELLVEKLRGLRASPGAIGVCAQVVRYVEENYMRPVTLRNAADSLHLSYSNLSARFSAEMGKGFNEYLTDVRIGKAKDLLLHSERTLSEIAEALGYADQSYLSRVFKKHEGISPLTYRRHRGQRG